MRISPILALGALVTLASAMPAQAWSVQGYVACDADHNGQLNSGDIPSPGVPLTVTSTTTSFVASGTTDSQGHYSIALRDVPDTYSLKLSTALPSGVSYVLPASGEYVFSTTDSITELTELWLVFSQQCVQPPPPPTQGACWMTAGGVKFDTDAGGLVAEAGPTDSFGGTGTLKGIDGNSADYGSVYFLAYVEDRNEPGSNGAKDGAQVDRYWLYVFSNTSDVAGSGKLLVNGSTSLSTFSPVPITGGNLQLHISSCDNPPLP